MLQLSLLSREQRVYRNMDIKCKTFVDAINKKGENIKVG